MSADRNHNRRQGACAECLRRSWLLSELSGPLEYCARDRGRLLDLLALEDLELLSAVAGSRAGELRDAHGRFEVAPRGAREATCRHRRGYPPALRPVPAAPALEVAGGTERLATLTAGPVVAIVGSTSASDYGIEMARCLARGLACSGVSVSAGLTDGIALAAHGGVLEAGGAGIAVIGDGLAVPRPARARSLYARVSGAGCAVSELPPDCRGRRWGRLAGERIVVGLAELTVVVEAADTPGDLHAARIAQATGRTVAAIPGRITSPLSRGTHALLIDGAALVRGTQDVLELLYARAGAQPAPATPSARGSGSDALAERESLCGLEPRLMSVLERVGAGADTPDSLARAGGSHEDLLLALSELELLGLLARGDGGRYLPRCPI